MSAATDLKALASVIHDDTAIYQSKIGDCRVVAVTLTSLLEVKVMPWRLNEQFNGLIEYPEKGQIFTKAQICAILDLEETLTDGVAALVKNKLETTMEWPLPGGLVISLDQRFPCMNIRKKWMDKYNGRVGYSYIKIKIMI